MTTLQGVVSALNQYAVMHTRGRGDRGGRKNTVNDLQIYSLLRQVLQSGNVSFLIDEQLRVLFLISNIMSSNSLE